MSANAPKVIEKATTAFRAPASDANLSLQHRCFDVVPFCLMNEQQFELDFFERVVAKDPCYEDVLMLLGDMYTRRGDFDKGLVVDRRLVRLRPGDATAYYNLACSYSLLDQLDDALSAMERAVKLGYRDMGHMLKDPDLANLRKDLRFRKLMGRMVEGAIRKS